MKVTPAYNTGTVAPKSKKVVWDIVDADGKEFDSWDVLAGKVTIKNGKVLRNNILIDIICHSDDQREEDELLRVRPKNLEYIKRE